MDWIKIVLITILQSYHAVASDILDDNKSENSSLNVFEDQADQEITTVLSRRKRYLTFPESSSLQLVFCVQTAALIPIGDIFLYGNTAALAWNLPTDPNFFYKFKDLGSAQRREDASKEIYYLDDKGNVISKVPYKRKPIVNPAFAKRSVENQNLSFKEKLKIKIDRLKMHEQQLKRDFLKKEHIDEASVEYHRVSRVGLYEKVEKLLSALGRDGRQCVLYKLCESAQSSPPQGTFLQELLRIVFTLPKGNDFKKEHHKEYDIAHASEDCAVRYPGCDDFEIPGKI